MKLVEKADAILVLDTISGIYGWERERSMYILRLDVFGRAKSKGEASNICTLVV